jgi:hypothetical protein
MWLTLDGPRILWPNERRLFCKAARCLMDRIVQGYDFGETNQRDETLTWDVNSDALEEDFLAETGIAWFDNWDLDQRLYLLDQVCKALLKKSINPPPRSAILEATIEAVFSVIHSEVADCEIELRQIDTQKCLTSTTLTDWQQLLLNAIVSLEINENDEKSDAKERMARVETGESNLKSFIFANKILFSAIASHLQTRIVGPTCYEQAEQFRDGPQERLEYFLKSKGLPMDYLTQIPPVPKLGETRERIQTLRSLLT